MVSIRRANENDLRLLSMLAITTFIESHGHSASANDIDSYVEEKYNDDVLGKELSDPDNIYHFLFDKETAAGFSKIILNSPYDDSKTTTVTKLERIYILKEYYSLGIGKELFDFNISFMKANNQSGVWLYTWIENKRAIDFYLRQGFKIIGSHDFKISATHSNPNHRMLLEF